MKKNLLTHWILILVALVTLTGFSPPAQADEVLIRITQIDTSDFPRVTVYLAATDAEGEPVGLNPARIQLLENETVIPLDQIQGAGQVEPLSVLLAVDISGSMLYAGKLEAARAAARAFVEGLRPEDQVGLLTFHTEIDYPQPLTTDRKLIYSAIEALEAVDDTALYDALLEGIGILSEVGGRKAIVLITDGLDTVSAAAPEDVLAAIGPAGLSISTVGLGDPEQDLAEKSAVDIEGLKFLAENAGGLYAYANDLESLTAVYQSYAASYQSEYQLTYTSPSVLRDGVNRALTVRLIDAPPAAGEQEALVYNPGGLVPEVSQPIPLPLFLALVAGLVALLFVPGVINLVLKATKKVPSKGKPAGKEKPQPRIKLKD